MEAHLETARPPKQRFSTLLIALTVVVLIASCGQPLQEVNIPFVAQFDGRNLHCGGSESGAALTDLRFYVFDLQLVDTDGRFAPVTLSENRWQQSDLAMLDLEDGAENCVNGTQEINAALHGTVAAGEYRGLRFTIGVPFERNHADPLSALAPLGDPSMHWHWRAGYKFLRAGMADGSDGFWIHLGSAGCEGTVRNISSCRYPNRVAVELSAFDPAHDFVVVDLTALLATTDLDDGVPTKCSSGPPENACVAPFGALGIDHDSGRIVAPQQVFLHGVGR